MHYLTSAVIALIAFFYVTFEYAKGNVALVWYAVLTLFCVSAIYISVRTLLPKKTH